MSKLFFSKKAQEEIEMMVIPAFALVIVFGVIFFGLISFVDDIRNNSLFEKIFLSKDTAILIDTLYVAPGSVEVNYPKDTFWFSYHFAPGEVEVYDTTDEIEPRREKHLFTDDSKVDFEEKEFKLDPNDFSYAEGLERELKLRFVKDADKIFVKEKSIIEDIPMRLYCPELESKETIGGKRSFPYPHLVPQDYLNDKEFKEEVKRASVAPIGYLSSNNIDANNIVAYVSSSSLKMKESNRLACLILNEIISDEKLKDDISAISIIFTDRFDILNYGNIAALFKIGNNVVKSEKDEETIISIGKSIDEGMRKYD